MTLVGDCAEHAKDVLRGDKAVKAGGEEIEQCFWAVRNGL